MAERCSIVVVTSEAETASKIASALKTSDRLAAGRVCKDLASLDGILREKPLSAVLVDISHRPKDVLAELTGIIARHEDTRFVVISDTVNNELILESMKAGARYFMPKSSIAADLVQTLHQLVPDQANGSEKGNLVTVLSAGGGCGATTLAINLANELGLLAGRPAMVVDFDTSYGSVANFLGLKGQYGLADVLDRRSIDRELIVTSSLIYSGTLHALLSPVSIDPSNPKPLKMENLDDALEAFKWSHAYTVIDAPRVSMVASARLASASKLTLIVLQLIVKDIQVAKAMLAALRERNVVTDTVMLVANRYRKRNQMIGLSDARTALGHAQFRCVCNDFDNVFRSINFGHPLAQTAPRSLIRRDLREIAEGLVLQPNMAVKS